ncbi:hypothetical protein DFH28DRAFT_1119481 [Melampsora americana]|nr:hypothetical protein DFH28DRAFT_1119481 [Melampsora americana]
MPMRISGNISITGHVNLPSRPVRRRSAPANRARRTPPPPQATRNWRRVITAPTGRFRRIPLTQLQPLSSLNHLWYSSSNRPSLCTQSCFSHSHVETESHWHLQSKGIT